MTSGAGVVVVDVVVEVDVVAFAGMVGLNAPTGRVVVLTAATFSRSTTGITDMSESAVDITRGGTVVVMVIVGASITGAVRSLVLSNSTAVTALGSSAEFETTHRMVAEAVTLVSTTRVTTITTKHLTRSEFLEKVVQWLGGGGSKGTSGSGT